MCLGCWCFLQRARPALRGGRGSCSVRLGRLLILDESRPTTTLPYIGAGRRKHYMGVHVTLHGGLTGGGAWAAAHRRARLHI